MIVQYGFNNITKRAPQVLTVGKELPLNQVADQVRNEMAQAGYTEILTMALLSRADNYDMVQHEDDGMAVTIANPKTVDYQVVRTSLIPGLLKTLQSNKKNKLPLQLFEVSDICVKTNEKDVGSKNVRKVCALYSNTHSGFEQIHGLLDRLMLMLEIGSNEYWLDDKQCEDNTFFDGRRSTVMCNGKAVGVIGVIHPQVLGNFELTYPVAMFEVDLEMLL
eukprot:TRINITY_DN1703_c0_g1_i3.p1 TRINITY_DN1703_c0_g1~~TRINITY_DN1703_c0_g1_i3.p1  ORF type:complete len:220 (+),score=90.78 TRINITY_DN1703_c0_g1_i3:126-785(+)